VSRPNARVQSFTSVIYSQKRKIRITRKRVVIIQNNFMVSYRNRIIFAYLHKMSMVKMMLFVGYGIRVINDFIRVTFLRN